MAESEEEAKPESGVQWTVEPKLKGELDLSTPMKKTDCYLEACEIQRCLERHRYSQDKCQEFVDSLHHCCVRVFHFWNGRIPVSCPDPHMNPLNQRYRDQLASMQQSLNKAE